LLVYAKYESIYLHIFMCTYKTHTHKNKYIISTQETWRLPGTGARLGGEKEGLVLVTEALHTQKEKKQEEKRKKQNI